MHILFPFSINNMCRPFCSGLVLLLHAMDLVNFFNCLTMKVVHINMGIMCIDHGLVVLYLLFFLLDVVPVSSSNT